MISKIKKRNGDVVDFDPEKLTRWAKWAGCVGADWFAIVGDAYKRCPDECTTQDLQNAMIQACADKEDTSHLKMAGRLLMGSVYKEAFGGVVPTVQEMYITMVDKGLWESMGYSILDLSKAQAFIDHERDLHSVHSVVHQITTKYAIRDIEKNIALESPAFVWMRMALGVCQNEPKETRMKEVEAYYKDFSLGKINAPTPNITNLGTPKRNYASCAIFKSSDNAKSLAAGDHIAYSLTCASAGIGGFLQTRSKGDGVRKNTIKHAGKLPYYRAVESAVHANLQGGRGGAATIHFNCLDPEVETLLRLRHPTTVAKSKVAGIDYSFGYHPLLAKKAAANEKWMLVSYKAAPELHEAMYKADGFEEAYAAYEASSGRRKYISARKLALEFLRMQEETGRMYEHNTNEMNRHTPFKDVVYSSNLCVAPETRILTRSGYKEIAGFCGQEVDIWNGKEWSNVVVVKTGVNRKLIKVITKDGFELECTPEHKFHLSIRNTGGTTWTIQKPAKELKKGDKLIKFDLPLIQGTETLENPYANGFYSGDGCFYGNDQMLYFYGEKKRLAEYCGDIFTRLTKQENQDRWVGYTRILKPKFFVPGCEYSADSRLKWLAGLLDSDGTVCMNGETQSFQIGSVEHEFLKEVQLMLQTLGIRSKVTFNQEGGMKLLPANNGTGDSKLFMCKTAYRVLIGNDGVSKLKDLGLVTHRLITTDHRPNRECSHFIKIAEIVDEGRYDDTYCFTEPKRNLAMFNGILTGQCQETGLPTQGFRSVEDLYVAEDVSGEVALCNLAAIVAGRVSAKEYEEVAYRALKMVDNVINQMDYPFPNLKYTAQARRSAGIGITNLANDLAHKGFDYTSSMSKAYMHRLAEMHSFYLHKASVRLAKERGKCDWFHKTKYSEGWLPIDTYCKQVDNITEQGNKLDWEGLRKEIAEHGMRNSVLEAYMPVESSSIAGNTTNGLYPIRDYVVIKTSGTNKTVFIAPDLEEVKDAYQLAWDVPTKDMTEMYAIFQKFCGQGISADFYRKFDVDKPRRISAKELMQDWFYRIKCGLKSKYYSNSAAGHKLSEVADVGCGSGGCTL